MTSILHIKSEVECHVYLFDEDKGIATPGMYFNLEVLKGKQDLMFVSTKDETVRCRLLYEVEEHDTGYSITVERTQFKQYTQEILDKLCLAEQGDAQAQCDLGVCYANGDGVEQDYDEAEKWFLKAVEGFRKAAEQGEVNAQWYLGKCYEYGKGVKQNYEKAMEWYRRAAEHNRDFQFSLGRRYWYGSNVEQDYKEAVKWYRKAAERGYARAQYELGYIYDCGWGVEQDYKEAVKWYRKAAERRDTDAQFRLGLCYANGKGVEQDYKEAVKWYRNAAEWDDRAKYQLGWCYENGKGVEQDYEEAVKWYREASHMVYQAQERLENLMEKKYYLFFDTETTGVPRDYKAPASNTNN